MANQVGLGSSLGESNILAYWPEYLKVMELPTKGKASTWWEIEKSGIGDRINGQASNHIRTTTWKVLTMYKNWMNTSKVRRYYVVLYHMLIQTSKCATCRNSQFFWSWRLLIFFYLVKVVSQICFHMVTLHGSIQIRYKIENTKKKTKKFSRLCICLHCV